MTARNQTGGPNETIRPFKSDIGAIKIEEQEADALDHFARGLSAIDNDLESIATNSKEQTELLTRLVAAVKFRFLNRSDEYAV